MTLVFVVAEGTVPRTAVSSQWNVIIVVSLVICLVYVVAKSLDAPSGRTPLNGDPRIPIAGDRSRAPLTQKVKLDGADLMMEVDTGAVASVISEETYRQLWTTPRRPKLKPSDVHLRTYTGERIEVKGQITVEAKYGGSTQLLDILVVGGKGPSLMGRDWLHKLKPNLSVYYMGRKGSLSLQGLMDGHRDLFKDELGLIKGVS